MKLPLINRTLSLIVCPLLIALGGCAYDWYHPTKNKQTFYAEQEQCETKAMQLYPQVIVPQQDRGGYTTPSTTQCNGNTCVTIPGTYIAPEYRMVDMNKQSREGAIFRCLQAQGWVLKKRE